MDRQEAYNNSIDFRQAFLEARNEATPDGVLVVDQKGKILLHNKNFSRIWSMPQHIVDNNDDEAALKHAMSMVADPKGFINRVKDIYQHPKETSYDEVQFADGRYIERHGKAVIGEDGTYFGWAWFFRDITARKQQELRHIRILESLPQMAWTIKPDGVVDYLNSRWYLYTGQSEKEALDGGWVNAISPETKIDVFEKWNYCLQNGFSYQAELQYRRYDGEYRWHTTSAVPIKEGNEIVLWVGSSTDIHDHKSAEEILEKRVQERTADLEQQRSLANSILEASINGVLSMDAVRNQAAEVVDFQITKINKALTDITGLDDSIIGKSYLQTFPHALDDGMFDLYCLVLKNGKPIRKEINSTLNNINLCVDLSAVRRDDNCTVITFANISDQRKAALQVIEQKSLLDSILRYSPAGITVYSAIRDAKGTIVDFQCIIANNAAEGFTGISNEERLKKTVLEITPDLKDSPLFAMAITAVEKGKPFRTEYYYEPIRKWLELSVVKMNDNQLINLFRDITPVKETQLALNHSAERFKAVFDAAQSGMFTFAPVKDESGEIIDFRFVITNPTFAQYVKQTPEVLNGELGSTWFPGYMTNGVFEMYKKTYLSGETQRIDVHYNVDQHDIYLDLQSMKVGDEVLVTFTDYTELKRAQVQLERHIDDLKRTNANLEEFAYAASHDLKEPVRKIQVFTDVLKTSLDPVLNEGQRHYFERVDQSAKRMSSLIDDLLLYSFITKGASFEREVNLNQKVALVLNDLDLEIEQKKAKITVDPLPTITGHRRQLQQLFQNLISNAIKYSRADIPPHVHITSKTVRGSDIPFKLTVDEAGKTYHQIEVGDNGIGFEQKDAERIFNVFTRLHANAKYKGTGFGLSIVQKIVENHNGFVWAESEPGKGATFKILLPVQ